MAPLTHLVVALHDREAVGNCLEKAARIGHHTGARITVVQTCWDTASEAAGPHFPQEAVESIAQRMKESELNALSAAIASYRERCANLHTQIIWAKHHEDAVARFAYETQADLIIAPRRHSGLTGRIALSHEIKLASLAHVPVLLSTRANWSRHVNVLVALDVTDLEHHTINEHLFSTARSMTAALGGHLHLMTASPPPSAAMQATGRAAAFQSQAEATRRDLLAALAGRHGLADAQQQHQLHVVTGSVTEAIDQLAASFEIELVVVGTAARTGIKRFVLGNTAELVLNQLEDVDLLMIPAPEGPDAPLGNYG